MLYPVELQAQTLTTERTLGRGRGIRTLDIQLPKLALYQAELRPVAVKVAHFLANASFLRPFPIALDGHAGPEP